MNSNIRRLAGQALDRAVPQTWTTLTAYDLNKFTEVFAELMTNRMLDIVDSHSEVFQTDRDQALIEHIKQSVKSDFGVKDEQAN